jgi:hypothetical protein
MIIGRQGELRRRALIAVTALLALAAIGATAASGAGAAEWSINGAPMVGSGISSEAASGEGGATHIGSAALGVEVNCSSSSTSSRLTEGGTSSDSIELTGCSVAAPAGCVVKAGTIPLSAVSVLSLEGTHAYRKFSPVGSDGTSSFGLLRLTECAAAANYKLAGAFAGELPSGESLNQRLLYSNAANVATGSALTLGGKVASLTGEATQKLVGPHLGQAWGIYRGTAGTEGTTGAGRGWYVNGSRLGGSASTTLFARNVAIVAPGLGFHITCAELGSRHSVIENTLSGGISLTTMVLSGCTMPEPVGCTIPGSIETSPLRGTLGALEGRETDLFAPASSEVKSLFNLKVSNCAAAGTYGVSGTLAAESDAVGLEAGSHSLLFSPAIANATGYHLTAGGKTVEVTASAARTLVSGQKFSEK